MAHPSLIEKLGDSINPIAVKEMRQAVSGRSIAWTFTIFVLAQLVVAATVLFYSEIYGPGYDMGRNVFMGHLAILLGTCLFYIPFSTAVRFSLEKSEQNIDLFFITALRPFQIIWGKTLAAMILTLLFFSASMPFLTLTYLLRGLDLPSAFVLLTLDFIVVAGCVQVGILLACFPAKVMSRGFCLLAGLPISFIAFYIAMQVSFGILYTGIGSSLGSWDFWGPALSLAAIAFMQIGLLFILAVTLITPHSANKALAVRGYLVFIWLVTGIISGIWSFKTSTRLAVQVWTLGMILMFSVTLVVSIYEREHLGPRVLRTVPSRNIFRLPAFFLYSGSASGISFSILMIVVTLAITPYFGTASVRGQDLFLVALGFACYVLGYSLTALVLKRLFFGNVQRRDITTAIILLLLMAGSAIPLAIGYVLHSGAWENLPSQWYAGNPLSVFWYRDFLLVSLPFTGMWALIVLIATLPWIIKRYFDFRRPLTVQINNVNPTDE